MSHQCPSCGNDNCSNKCGNSQTSKKIKAPILKRMFSRFLKGVDCDGCEVNIEPRKGILISDGERIYFADGSEELPIELGSIDTFSEGASLVAFECGRLKAVESSTKRYIAVEGNQIILEDDPTGVPCWLAKYYNTANGKLAVITQDEENSCFGIAAIIPNGDCDEDKRYFITVNCEGGEQKFVEQITKLSQLINNSSQTGNLVLIDDCEGRIASFVDSSDCVNRWFLSFEETEEDVNSDCNDVVAKKKRWHKSRSIKQMITSVPEIVDSDEMFLATWRKSGDCIELSRLTMEEGKLLIGGKNGQLTEATPEEVFESFQSNLKIGAYCPNEPLKLAEASGLIDLSTAPGVIIPTCAGTLYAILQGHIRSVNNNQASMVINGAKFLSAGSNSGGSDTASAVYHLDISGSTSFNLTINNSAVQASENIPRLELMGFCCK